MDETTTRNLMFKDHRSGDVLSVKINEILDPQYGLFLWPCAPVLAQFVFYHRENFINKNVLELGAGTSLPGIVAAKTGAKVVFSDSHKAQKCLELCKANLRANDLLELKDGRIQVIPITWGLITKEMITMDPVDIILASDCFYEEKDFEDVLMTVSFLIHKKANKDVVFYTTYQERDSDWNVECILKRLELRSEYIDLKLFSADESDVANSRLPGPHSVLLIKITK